MDYIETKHPTGIGTWLLILDCPRNLFHHLHDEERLVSGPSFALCASCEHQAGADFENYDPEVDLCTRIFPDRLKCGFGR